MAFIIIQIFQAWKVSESGLCHEKLWQMKQMVAAYLFTLRFGSFHCLAISYHIHFCTIDSVFCSFTVSS